MQVARGDGWMDKLTKEMSFMAVVYNANVDLWARVTIRFDFKLTGQVEVTPTVQVTEMR